MVQTDIATEQELEYAQVCCKTNNANLVVITSWRCMHTLRHCTVISCIA